MSSNKRLVGMAALALLASSSAMAIGGTYQCIIDSAHSGGCTITISGTGGNNCSVSVPDVEVVITDKVHPHQDRTIVWRIDPASGLHFDKDAKPAVVLFTSKPQEFAKTWKNPTRDVSDTNYLTYQWTLMKGAKQIKVSDKKIRFFPFVVNDKEVPCDVIDPIIGNGSN
jgi:hypothetical protein